MNPVLVEVLTEAQRRGWVGQGPLEPQLRHAGAFTHQLGEGPGVVFDLGSGGGLPALPMALARADWRFVLVEAQLRRADHLQSAVRRLGLGERVVVVHARAEELGRDPAYRGGADVVTARSFGPPAVVAECGAPFLRVGGRLIVSEPPEDTGRWPEEGLALVGLSARREEDDGAGARLAVFTQEQLCPERYPRRGVRAAASPLF